MLLLERRVLGATAEGASTLVEATGSMVRACVLASAAPRSAAPRSAAPRSAAPRDAAMAQRERIRRVIAGDIASPTLAVVLAFNALRDALDPRLRV